VTLKRLFGTLKGLCASCGCLPRPAAPASSDSLRRGTGVRHIARPRPGARSPEASLLHKMTLSLIISARRPVHPRASPRSLCEPWHLPQIRAGRLAYQFFPAVFASLETTVAASGPRQISWCRNFGIKNREVPCIFPVTREFEFPGAESGPLPVAWFPRQRTCC
jgi:hypothetical protein